MNTFIKKNKMIEYLSDIFKSVMEAMTEAVLILDRTDHVMVCNDRFVKIFMLPESMDLNHEKIHIQWITANSPDFKELMDQIDQTCLCQKIGSPIEIRLKSGVVISVHYVPLISNELEVGRIWLYRDITTWTETKRKLQQAKETAEAASIAKNAFWAHISHELRTPLNAILGFAQIALMDNNLTDQHKAIFDNIFQSGQNLLNLINKLIELSGVEENPTTLDIDRRLEVMEVLEHAQKSIPDKKKYSSADKIDQQSILALPEDVKDKLKRAVLEVDFEMAMTAIDSIRKINAPLAETIEVFVQNYEFDRLYDLFSES